jgi:4-cresol dehydrogenase (hydroxylating)
MFPRNNIFESEVSDWLNLGDRVESLCGNHRIQHGVIRPQSVSDVQCILHAAFRAAGAVKLQPLSCGKNWGFGSDLATRDGTYILDLSGLRNIRSLNLRSHCVELEPGVTQGQLDEALSRQGNSHYFNVTGAGLGTSIIGNALERGIGYSGQRHLDLLDLEVVLPDGQLTRTSRMKPVSFDADGAYLGGLGPDPTGLFCQSNFGVVTAATIALFRRPEVMGGVLCRLSDADSFPQLISVVADLISEGACYGVPHIFNRERIVTTFSPHLDPSQSAELRSNTAPWTALIPIRGSKRAFDALAQDLEDRLKPLGRVELLSDKPGTGPKLSSLIEGRPSDLALASVAFSVFGHSSPPINTPINATGAGLIHVTPAMPLCGATIKSVEKLTTETLRRHGYEAIPLSLNALSARTAALIVSIGFDRRSGDKTEAAHRAADELLEVYLDAGLVPYRLGLRQGEQLPTMDGPWPKLFREMQRLFDPRGCLAPSRYEPLWRKDAPRQSGNKLKEAELCRP